MAWYYILLIVVAALGLAVLLFLVCKTLWGHIVSWDGGFCGFLQAMKYVIHFYAIKYHIITPKTLPLRENSDEVEDEEENDEELTEEDKKWFTLTPEQIEEIERKTQEYAIEAQKEKEAEEKWDRDNKFHVRAALRINKSIPFNFDLGDKKRRLAIYYESYYDEGINNYIRSHYDEMTQLFRTNTQDVTFVYFPLLLENAKESVKYNYPDAIDDCIATETPECYYKVIKENIVRLTTDYPKILITDFYNSAGYPKEMLGDSAMSCFYIDLEYINDEQFSSVLKKHAKQFAHDTDVLHQFVPLPDKRDKADDSPIDEIAKEIQARISQLYAMGVSEYIISKIVSLPEPKLSTLLITEDFRIFLPDYNNMEIKMPTLSKALYFFYLSHPEGVLFKELRDHKAELSEIYRTISPLENMDKIEKSIDDIIDSTKNSVNEKCSRIKTAFVSQFNENLAKNYYITGGAGEPKTIKLDRKLINDCAGLIRI